jgi:O-antigen ligase
MSNSVDQNQTYTRLADKIGSITDVSGNRHYHGEIGDSAADNNQFRIVWWKTVFDETLRKGPFFGLGFGYDLTSSFMRAYYPTGGEDTATTRSPHSVWLTVFGRMGLVGLITFTLITVLMIREAMATARLVARRKVEPFNLAFWTGAIIILGSASFGVVLEGPMGGILFWTFLGLASSQLHQYKLSVAEAREIDEGKSQKVARAPALVRA